MTRAVAAAAAAEAEAAATTKTKTKMKSESAICKGIKHFDQAISEPRLHGGAGADRQFAYKVSLFSDAQRSKQNTNPK